MEACCGVSQLVKLGALEPLDSYLEADADFAAGITGMSPTKWLGETYMLNWYNMPYAYTYNVEAFAEAGLEPPTNWDEFKDVTRALNESDVVEYGAAGMFGHAIYTPYYTFGVRLAQLGGKFYDENSCAVVNSAEGVQAMIDWKELYDDGTLAPGAMRAAYGDEATMRKTWAVVTDFCIKHKSQVKLFWNDADTQKNGLMNQGVVVGQTWDGPPITLMQYGDPVQDRAPAEGSLAWVDGMSLSTAAEDIDAVYAFIDYCFAPEPAGKSIDGGGDSNWGGHGYNSAVLGAERYASGAYGKMFGTVYPGDSLANLWPWPKEPQWYADVRTEYRNKFVNA